MVKYPVSKLNQKCISIVEDKLWTFRLFRASIHVGIQKLTFHACLFMHLAWQIIQLPDLVITLEFLEFCNSRAFSLFYCENDTKISFSGYFQHDESPGIKSVLIIALELILDSFQDLNLKKCGYFLWLSYTKLAHCRTVWLKLNFHFVWNCIKKYEIKIRVIHGLSR